MKPLHVCEEAVAHINKQGMCSVRCLLTKRKIIFNHFHANNESPQSKFYNAKTEGVQYILRMVDMSFIAKIDKYLPSDDREGFAKE